MMISMFLTTFLDDINFLGFCLLPFVLPSSGRKEKNAEGDAAGDASATRKQKVGRPRKTMATLKASDKDAYKSMIMVKPVS
jgi:hypothetical protein